jgi:hypothetical protein
MLRVVQICVRPANHFAPFLYPRTSKTQGFGMVDLEELRTRLRNMTDSELEGYGFVAKIMCSFTVNANIPPRECFVVQLRESQAEWVRRKGVNSESF